jgi:hypothetical protein
MKKLTLAVFLAGLLAGSAWPALGHHLPAGVTEVRASGEAQEGAERVLARFPSGTSRPTFQVIVGLNRGPVVAGVTQGNCTLFVRIDPAALPLVPGPTDPGLLIDNELYISDGGIDAEIMLGAAGGNAVSHNGETLRFTDVAVHHDQFGCWAGAVVQYAPRFRQLYR